jgi:uncharacterized protein (TIGR03032 family)
MQLVKTTWSPGLPEFFQQHPCSLLITSMREGAILLIQPCAKTGIEVSSYALPGAGGVTEHRGRLCISGSNGYYSFLTHDLGREVLHQVKTKIYYGLIQPHELHSNNKTIWVGNTGFNCIAEVNENSSFKPFWHPPFIDPEQSLGDRCHLNGFAICPQTQKPEYATVFCRTNKQRGWREGAINEGCVYEISTNTVICQGLIRPHSPRIYENKLFILESGTGKLIAIDRQSHNREVIHETKGFVRGLHLCGETAIIGVSAFRETFHNLPNADPDTKASLIFVNLSSGTEIARLCFEELISEFFSVTVLPHKAGSPVRHAFDVGTGHVVSIGQETPQTVEDLLH